MTEEFTADWVVLYSLALFCFCKSWPKTSFQLMITAASKIVARYVNRSHNTIEKWRVEFLKELPWFSAWKPNYAQISRRLFEYGQNRDGYWNNNHFMSQMESASELLKQNIPHIFSNMFGYLTTRVAIQHLPLLHHASTPAMRDTVWADKTQKLVETDGTPKGAAKIHPSGLKLEDEDNFSQSWWFQQCTGHLSCPKSHCELNGIERVWGHASALFVDIATKHWNQSKQNIPMALDSISPVTTFRGA